MSILITTHNDQGSIGPLIASLRDVGADQIVVVASGCSDDTVAIVGQAREQDGAVDLIVEPERTGKSAAFNLGLSACHGEIVVLVAGDVLPAPDAIGLLVAALDDPTVGIAGGRPVPQQARDTLTDHAVHLLWELHHHMALRRPKVGEVAALRASAVAELPPTSVDEAHLQAQVERAGWRAVYVPDALVHNHGPRNVRDFIRQRRRIHAGHLHLRHDHGYTVPSLYPTRIAADLARWAGATRAWVRPRWLARTGVAVILEALARSLAHIDVLRGKEDHVWPIVESAKFAGGAAAGVDGGGGTKLASLGLATAAADQRDGERDLPL